MATKKAVCGAGSPSVQPHIQLGRVQFKRFIEEQKILQDAPKVVNGKVVQPKLALESGLVVIPLNRALKRGEMRELNYLFVADPEAAKEKYAAKDVEAKKRGIKEPEEAETLGQFQLLVRTSKMGAYSFNLPAGPSSKQSLGTCPISALHWPIKAHQSGPADLDINELPKASAFRPTSEITQERGWICSDCYAMKGNYGTPLMIIGGELKRSFVMRYAEIDRKHPGLGAKAFADLLEMSIRWAQLKSVRALRSLAGKIDKKTGIDLSTTVQRPQFFRIHDAGDFGLGDWYVQAWFDVAERLSRKLNVRMPKQIKSGTAVQTILTGTTTGEMETLPAVTLWAATRAWGVNKGLQKRMLQDAGELGPTFNLVIRPSALFFGDKPPRLNGQKIVVDGEEKVADRYAEGSSGDCHGRGVETLGDFVCPAYTPLDPSKPHVVPGSCQMSRGKGWETDPNMLPAPVGEGCRVCWNHPELSVVYVRH